MQSVLTLIFLAIALGSDAFSVAVCIGMSGTTTRQRLRLSAAFGGFQFIMPIIGLTLGSIFGGFAGKLAGYIGGAILIVLGLIMVWRSLRKEFQCPLLIHESIVALISASVGVSLDALAVGAGFGLSVSHIPIVAASIVIGVIAFIMTIGGLEVGGRLGEIIHHRASLVGGGILTILGIAALFGRL